ncbi:MAG: AAA family ATPase [Candidatus Heimdallarchaeota archaeon]|nr:AAA family ATPase [Candidatus Heimdallarchaeota archaeon]
MIYWDEDDALLLSTGLPLEIIANVLFNSDSEESRQSMLKAIGGKYLQRYLIMKEYRSLVRRGEQKMPLILLLAGMPGVGKSVLAKELSTAFGIDLVIGGDVFRSAFRSVLPRAGNEAFFTSIYNSWKVISDQYSENTAVEGFKAQAKIMNQAVQHLIADRGFRDGESMVLEYLHFLPSQFDPGFFNHPSFISIILKINDLSIYEERLASRSRFSHLRSPGERLLDQKERYLLFQDYQCEEAVKFHLPVIPVDHFPQAFDQILDVVFLQIQQLNRLKDYQGPEIELLEKIKKDRALNS